MALLAGRPMLAPGQDNTGANSLSQSPEKNPPAAPRCQGYSGWLFPCHHSKTRDHSPSELLLSEKQIACTPLSHPPNVCLFRCLSFHTLTGNTLFSQRG